MESNIHKFCCKKPVVNDEEEDKNLLKIFPQKILPESVDLTDQMPDVYNQLDIGSCTANATSYCYKFVYKDIEPSRLYLYYKARELSNSEKYDNGSTITDVMMVLKNNGVCEEHLYPYDVKKFADKPSEECNINAHQHKIISPKKVKQNLYDIKCALNDGHIIAFGLLVKQSIMNLNNSNYIYNPFASESVLGGHALTIIGYNQKDQLFKIRNSWGLEWGNDGNFYIPYNIIMDKAATFDMWLIEK